MTHYMATMQGRNQDFVFTYHTTSRTQRQENREPQRKGDIQTEGKNCNFLVEERPKCSDIRLQMDEHLNKLAMSGFMQQLLQQSNSVQLYLLTKYPI
jgi:hypothetical protein